VAAAARLVARLGRYWLRLAGVGVLLLVLLLQAGLGPALLDRPRLALFDFYARLLPRTPVSDPVAIVAIDEASLAAVGQWPWPRHRLAELVRRILAARPAVLGIDLLWPEPDRLSPANWARGEGALPAPVASALAVLPDHDADLAAALAAGPVVLAVAGEREGRPGQAGPTAMVLARGGDPFAWLPAYDGQLRSLPVLDAAARGHGLVSVDKSVDGLVRRLPLISGVAGGLLVPSLSLEMLRLVVGAGRIDLLLDAGGVRGVVLGGLGLLPTAPDGFAWLDLSPHADDRFVSAAAVLAGTMPPERLQRKLVLLGITGLGLQDLHATPLGPMWGVELHAQFLENVVDGQLPARPRWAPWAELGLTALLGLAQVALLPRLRLLWYPLAALLPLVLLAAAGLAAWHWKLWLIDVATPALGGGVVYVALLGGGFADSQAQRRELRRALEAQRLRDARIAGELDAARRIQLGILPRPESVAGDPRFQLAAAIAPAREVAGDLYDFFKITDSSLFVMIGDVSGKGVPASLFMALGKALYKSCVLRGERDIGTVMAAANAEISRDNVESMFITLFAAVLDLDSGALAFCNAGHDAPFLLRPPGPPEDLANVGGPPLGVMEDFPYATEHRRLQPGELLVLTTDGVTEAMNPAGALMGRTAAAAALADLPADAGAPEAIAALQDAVARFAAGAEPSDDVTMVALAWHGPPQAGAPLSAP
jgi:serine phosphatase RsbU (regulator of sigma subunit)/CHASE2 domain-containing sensor protein